MKYNLQVAAIYCRLSKEDMDKLNRGDESESIQNQKKLLTEYAQENGFTVYKIYVDEDYNGFCDRPQFKQLLQDAEKGFFNIILCKHQSRFTRDLEIVERYIHGYFLEWGIRFISLTDNADTSVKGNKKSRQINGLMNEWYSEDLSENVRAVFRKKMEHGEYIGAFACYGYMKDPKDKHKLIVDTEAAEVVKEIFNLYISGMGGSRIAGILTERGMPTPTQYKLAQGINMNIPQCEKYCGKYGQWSEHTIYKFLKNPCYIGSVVQHKQEKISYKSKKQVQLPKSEWIVVPDMHEPIIDKKTFETVQRLLENRRKNAVPKGEPHLLAGKVKCMDCGETLQRSGTTRDGKTRYLRCSTYTRTRTKHCSSHSINQTAIENIILTRIQNFINGELDNTIIDDVYKQIEAGKSTVVRKKKKLAETENKVKQIQRNLALAYADKLDGAISETEYHTFKTVFEEEIETLSSRSEALKKEITGYENKKISHGNIQTLLHKYKKIDCLTHEIMNDFIISVEVGEKDKAANEQQVIINWNI